MRECWFRVHTSILDSPKFERISLAARGLWVSLGALARDREFGGRLARRDGSPMDAERIAREIGYHVEEVAPLLGELVEAGLLDIDGDGAYRLHDWDEWQTRAEERERWRTYKREKKADVPSSSNEFQPVPTSSNDFQPIPGSSNEFQEVPTGSNGFQKIPLENQNQNQKEKENKNRIEYTRSEDFSSEPLPEKAETVVERVARIMGIPAEKFPIGCDQWLARYVTADVSDAELTETFERWKASGNDPLYGGRPVYRWVSWLAKKPKSPPTRAAPDGDGLVRIRSLLNDPEYVRAVLNVEVVHDESAGNA
jgi:hypothetical protein